jgi:glucans biosynthesis protein
MYKRRDLLKLAVGSVAAAVVESTTAHAQSPVPSPAPATPPVPQAQSFDAARILDMARDLAKRPYKAPNAPLGEPFASLPHDLYVSIKSKPDTHIWKDANTGFVIEPLHRGSIFSAQIQIHLVENGFERKLAYATDLFDFGKVSIPPNIGDLGFSGFRILRPIDGRMSEVAIFQGASFFRARANHQNFGVVARGLSIRTADPRGEETPSFRAIF